MKKGFQKLVLTPGKNKRINAFITFLYPIKSIKYNIFNKRNSKIFKKHLIELLILIRRKGFNKIILILDNVSYHKSKDIKRFIKKHSQEIKLFFLPRYSPNLNEVEGRINKLLKEDIGSNHSYKNIEELRKDVSRYLRRLNNRWQK